MKSDCCITAATRHHGSMQTSCGRRVNIKAMQARVEFAMALHRKQVYLTWQVRLSLCDGKEEEGGEDDAKKSLITAGEKKKKNKKKTPLWGCATLLRKKIASGRYLAFLFFISARSTFFSHTWWRMTDSLTVFESKCEFFLLLSPFILLAAFFLLLFTL